MGERWAKVAAFADYSVSSEGRVRLDVSHGRHRAGTLIKTKTDERGGVVVNLRRGERWKQRSLARLVLLAFGEPPGRDPRTMVVGYKNGDRRYCRIENLRWVRKSDAPKFQSPANGARSTSKTRRCLRCLDDFESSWSGNRLCPRCRERVGEHHEGCV